MFSASYDRRRRILLARFTGLVGLDAFEEFEQILAVVAEAEEPVDAILDLTEIEAFDRPIDFVRARNAKPPILPECKRIFVARDARVRRLAQRYIDHHALGGFHSLLLASSVDEAVALLDIGTVSFRPLDIEWLRKDLREEAAFEAEIHRLH
jgi:hypothetical protein